jgi:hypothetical protein
MNHLNSLLAILTIASSLNIYCDRHCVAFSTLSLLVSTSGLALTVLAIHMDFDDILPPLATIPHFHDLQQLSLAIMYTNKDPL